MSEYFSSIVGRKLRPKHETKYSLVFIQFSLQYSLQYSERFSSKYSQVVVNVDFQKITQFSLCKWARLRKAGVHLPCDVAAAVGRVDALFIEGIV